MVFFGQVSGLVKNFNIGICSDTIHVINLKLCMVVLFIEFNLFTALSVTLTMFQGHSNVKQFLLRKFCVLIQLSLNFVVLLRNSSR